MEIIKDLKNDLLKRREVKLLIKSDKNPGFTAALDKVAEKFNVNKDFVFVNNVRSKFGRDTFLIDAFVYHSAEDKERLKPKTKVKKSGEAAPAKAAGAKK
jgi:ribosomal protein S24E